MLSLCAALAACSNDDGDDACSPSNLVDDGEVASTTLALSPSERRGVARTIDGLPGSPPPDAAARSWSEAPRSAEHALVRDYVETLLIDVDVEVASRFIGTAEALSPTARDRAALAGGEARYTSLRRVVVAGDLVLARSEGERAGAAREFHDLFRVSEGRVIERWSAERASTSGTADERLF